MSKVSHKVSITTPFTVASIVGLCQELSGLSADREVLLTVVTKEHDDKDEEDVYRTAWAKLEVEF